jgi:hypothetical protein
MGMSGINEIQSRIQAIQTRVANPPIAGRFSAVFEAQLAAANAQAATEAAANTEAADAFSVAPLGSPSTAQAFGAQAMTLGMMLGVTTGPTTVSPSGSVMTRAELAEYLLIHNIEERNGRLDTSELTPVSGAWHGTGYLLPPAAAAWEEMRAAAAADGIDLKAIDLYRSWETQSRAYEAHLRGDKKEHVLPPGTSEHGNGLAVDITNGHIIGTQDPEHEWMRSNAARYGWHPISNETWHWEFRGTGA